MLDIRTREQSKLQETFLSRFYVWHHTWRRSLCESMNTSYSTAKMRKKAYWLLLRSFMRVWKTLEWNMQWKSWKSGSLRRKKKSNLWWWNEKSSPKFHMTVLSSFTLHFRFGVCIWIERNRLHSLFRMRIIFIWWWNYVVVVNCWMWSRTYSVSAAEDVSTYAND